jgi:hypothetical protein
MPLCKLLQEFLRMAADLVLPLVYVGCSAFGWQQDSFALGINYVPAHPALNGQQT